MGACGIVAIQHRSCDEWSQAFPASCIALSFHVAHIARSNLVARDYIEAASFFVANLCTLHWTLSY